MASNHERIITGQDTTDPIKAIQNRQRMNQMAAEVVGDERNQLLQIAKQNSRSANIISRLRSQERNIEAYRVEELAKRCKFFLLIANRINADNGRPDFEQWERNFRLLQAIDAHNKAMTQRPRKGVRPPLKGPFLPDKTRRDIGDEILPRVVRDHSELKAALKSYHVHGLVHEQMETQSQRILSKKNSNQQFHQDQFKSLSKQAVVLA